MEQQPISFYSEGYKLDGDLFLPEVAQIEPVISGEIEPVIDSGDAQQREAENNNQDEDSQDQP